MLLHKPISNVTLFSGKEYVFRAQIIYYLAIHGESTTWDISRFISDKEIHDDPSRTSMIIKSHSSGVYRNIKERMLPEKYVQEIGRRISKGNNVVTYGLSFRGSLIVLSLDLKKDELRSVLEKNYGVNPFYKLILSLEANGVKFDLCDRIILKGLINGIKNRLINLSSDNEAIIGQSVIPALHHHLSSINRSELKKLQKDLDKILDKKFSNQVSSLFNSLAGLLINPLFWSIWSNDENAQLMTLYSLVDVTLNPQEYNKLSLNQTPKPRYDTRLDEIGE